MPVEPSGANATARAETFCHPTTKLGAKKPPQKYAALKRPCLFDIERRFGNGLCEKFTDIINCEENQGGG
jgi:hypothetical protein